jgi:hypothetical protein
VELEGLGSLSALEAARCLRARQAASDAAASTRFDPGGRDERVPSLAAIAVGPCACGARAAGWAAGSWAAPGPPLAAEAPQSPHTVSLVRPPWAGHEAGGGPRRREPPSPRRTHLFRLAVARVKQSA